jgi:adhesin transport system outer membrane protein
LTAYSFRLEQESAHAAAAIEFTRLTNVLPRKIKLPLITELGRIPGDFDQAITFALDLNPDLASLRAEIEAAENDRIAAKTGMLPKVDLEMSDFRVTNAGGHTGLQNDQRLMVVVNWALFEGGRTLKLTDERQARKDEAVLRLDDSQRRLVQALSAQYAALAAVRDRIDLGYAEFEVLKSALAAVSERMLSGNQSLLDLLDVYERLYQARVRLVNLHVQEFTAASQIIRNIYGSGGTEPTAATPPAK